MEIQNFRQIRVKYYPQTNKRNARIKIYEPSRYSGDLDRQKEMRVFIQSDVYMMTDAQKYLQSKGFNIIGQGNSIDEGVFLCDNWADDFIEVNGTKREI
tara:strand:+ start:338 stop:634 length:297 start_codon:yes stop_codon:yes gene_type:complete